MKKKLSFVVSIIFIMIATQNKLYGQTGINTMTPTAGYGLTVKTSAARNNGIDMELVAGSSGSIGINLATASANHSGISYANSSAAAGVFYGFKSDFTGGTATTSFLGYRSSGGTPKTYGVYATGGDYAGYFTNKVVITSSNSPTGISDLEVQNTTAGAGNPATIGLRQTTSLNTAGNVLGNYTFGDNNTTAAQAFIQATRGTTQSGGDLSTSIGIWTTPAGSTTPVKRLSANHDGTVQVNALTTNGFVRTTGGNGTLTSSALVTADLPALGQSVTTALGSSTLGVTSSTTSWTLVPGLSITLTIPSNCIVEINSDGGFTPMNNTGTTHATADVGIFIDGAATPVNGGWRRITTQFLGTSGTTSSTLYGEPWSMTIYPTLTAGSHTIEIKSIYVTGNSTNVSSNGSTPRQGTLNVSIIKQ